MNHTRWMWAFIVLALLNLFFGVFNVAHGNWMAVLSFAVTGWMIWCARDAYRKGQAQRLRDQERGYQGLGDGYWP